MASQIESATANGVVEAQEAEWNSTAAGWSKWWPWMEEGSRISDRRCLELAGVRTGELVLDLATGLGEPAFSAAKIVGDTGRVVGVDIAPNMHELARERATSAGVANIEYREADARSLPFEDDSFDVVTCRSSLMPEPERVVGEARRVLRTGGRCASVVLGHPQTTPMIGLAFGVIQKMLDLTPPPPGTPSFYALSKPGSVEEIYNALGIEHLMTEQVIWKTSYDSAAKYVEFLQDIAAQVIRLVDAQPEETQGRIWGQIERAA